MKKRAVFLISVLLAILLSGCAALIPVAEIGIDIAAAAAERSLEQQRPEQGRPEQQAAPAVPRARDLGPPLIEPNDLLDRPAP